MVELDEFYDSIVKLSNSLVIKIKDVAIANNNYSLIRGIYVDPVDAKSWRYFMNLAGEKHPSNNDVKIVLMESGETVSLSKEILRTHPYTKRELLKNEEYYELLITNYPEDLLYIHGCLYPVDISTAIEAEDGTILAYNKTFVEDAELSLIRELELFTKNFIRRWYNSDITIVENLFLPAFLSIFYSSIPNKIFNIRLDKVFTNEVHSFHLEHFFRSKYDIWNNVQILNKKSLYWLYRNMNYLRKHVGKQKTFDIILDKIYDANSVGVGEYMVRIPDATINVEDENNLTESSFTRADASSITSALNKNYILDNNEETPIPTLVGMELETTKNTMIISQEMSNFIQEETAKTLQKNLQDNVKTKTLDINGLKLFKTNGTDIVTLALDYWMYSLKNGNFNSILVGTNDDGDEIWEEPVIEYIEPNDKKIYNVKPSIGYLMALKVLLMITNNLNKKIRTTTYTTVLKTDKSTLDNVQPMFDGDGYIQGLIGAIKDTLPWNLGKVTSPEVFGDHLNYIFKFHEFLWELDSNSENILVSANLKLIFNRLRIRGNYSLSTTYKTIDQLLEDNDVNYVLNESFNLQESFFTLIKTFTTLFVDPYEIIRNSMIDYIEILNKITSYTTHTIMSTRDDTSNTLFYNNLGVLLSKTGIVNITRGEFIPREHKYANTKAAGNDFSDYGIASYDELFSYIRACGSPFEMVAYWNDVEYYEAPKLMISQTKINDYFVNRCNCKNIFLRGVTAIWYPSEDVDIKTKLGINNHTDILNGGLKLRTMFAHSYLNTVGVLAYEIDMYHNISNPLLYVYQYKLPNKLLDGIRFSNNDYQLLKGVTAIWYPYGLDKTKTKAEANGNYDDLTFKFDNRTMFISQKVIENTLKGVTTVWNPSIDIDIISNVKEYFIADDYRVNYVPYGGLFYKIDIPNPIDKTTVYYNPNDLSAYITKADNNLNPDVMKIAIFDLPEYKFISDTKEVVEIKGGTIFYGQDSFIKDLKTVNINFVNKMVYSINDSIGMNNMSYKLNTDFIKDVSMIPNVTIYAGFSNVISSVISKTSNHSDTGKTYVQTEPVGNMLSSTSEVDDVNNITVHVGQNDNEIKTISKTSNHSDTGKTSIGLDPNININSKFIEVNGIKNISLLTGLYNYTIHNHSEYNEYSDYMKYSVEDNVIKSFNIDLNNSKLFKSKLSFAYTQTINSSDMESFTVYDGKMNAGYVNDEDVNVVINKRRVKSFGLNLAGYVKVNNTYVKQISTGGLDKFNILTNKATHKNIVDKGNTINTNNIDMSLDAYSDGNNIPNAFTTNVDTLEDFYIPEPVIQGIKVKDIENDVKSKE